MRILTLIYEFPPVGGGGGRAAYDICRELARRGHEVTVLTAHIQGLPFHEIKDGIRVERVASLRKDLFRADFFTMLAYVIAGVGAGLRLIRSRRPQVLHVHFAVPSGALAWVLSVLTGLPYVLTAHLGDVPGGVPEKTGKWFRWLMPFTKPIWRRARHVAAVSEFTRQLALKHYPVPVQVIPNGVDISHFPPSVESINLPPRLVFAGRFVHQKNPNAIIQVLAGLKELDWNCCMMGDGPLMLEVREAIEAHGLQSRFTLTGWVTPEGVLDQFSQSDILFMPSFSEGLPVVGVQALAAGLAIVASQIGGFLDLVEDGQNGHLIEVHDQAAFIQVLRRLISNPDQLLAFRRASLQKSRQFDIQHVVDAYLSIFDMILPG